MTTLNKLEHGIDQLDSHTDADRRWNYYKGNHDLPFAPAGVNYEYMDLREQAKVPLIRLAMRLPVQRLRVGGIRSFENNTTDTEAWKVFIHNRLATASKTLYTHALVLGYGVVSVWKGENFPSIKVEDPDKLHIEYRTDDPSQIDYVVKRVMNGDEERAYVYEAETITVFTRHVDQTVWDEGKVYKNDLGRVPFVVFAPERDADGTCNSMVDALIPMQKAIDTMRFNLLLAAQFAAYRQRVIVGYDPVVRDGQGNPIVQTDDDGEPITDGNGNAIPMLTPSPKVGVDRFLAFSGEATKVFDMQESDLKNYTVALDQLVHIFASTAQVPAQYLVGEFKNVSGELMTATEATLRSYVFATQQAGSDFWRDVFEMAGEAQGQTYGTEVIWQDASPKSLSEIADATSKMVPNGAPITMFLSMIENVDQAQVEQWHSEGKNALTRALANDLSRQFDTGTV